MRSALPCAVALALLGAGCAPAAPQVRCEAEGYAATYRGPHAIHACLDDPAMQQAPGLRRARLGAGAFAIAPGRRLELGDRWSLEGEGPGRTQIHPAEAGTLPEFAGVLAVMGRDVALRGFSFDGRCQAGPSPGPGCASGGALFGIVIACDLGRKPDRECDVDGLVVEDVRIGHAKDAFVATGAPGSHTRFRDFLWHFRGIQVEPGFRHARIFSFGGAGGTARGPGSGAREPRRYRIRLEDSDIDVSLGFQGGLRAALVDLRPGSPQVELRLELARVRLRGTGRVIHAEAPYGRVVVVATDAQLLANHAGWDEGTPGCPPRPAAVELRASAAGSIAARFERSRIALEGTTCPAPSAFARSGDVRLELIGSEIEPAPPPEPAHPSPAGEEER